MPPNIVIWSYTGTESWSQILLFSLHASWSSPTAPLPSALHIVWSESWKYMQLLCQNALVQARSQLLGFKKDQNRNYVSCDLALASAFNSSPLCSKTVAWGQLKKSCIAIVPLAQAYHRTSSTWFNPFEIHFNFFIFISKSNLVNMRVFFFCGTRGIF